MRAFFTRCVHERWARKSSLRSFCRHRLDVKSDCWATATVSLITCSYYAILNSWVSVRVLLARQDVAVHLLNLYFQCVRARVLGLR